MGESWGGDNSNDTSLPSFNALAHSILWVGFPDTLLFEPLQFHINPQALHCSCWLWRICRCVCIYHSPEKVGISMQHIPPCINGRPAHVPREIEAMGYLSESVFFLSFSTLSSLRSSSDCVSLKNLIITVFASQQLPL